MCAAQTDASPHKHRYGALSHVEGEPVHDCGAQARVGEGLAQPGGPVVASGSFPVLQADRLAEFGDLVVEMR